MPFYETVFMARQDLSDTQVKALVEQFSKILTDAGGKIHKTESWGLLSLAYRIKKAKKAHYSLIESDAPAEAIIEMERQMRLHEDVVRSLTIRNDKLSDGPSPMMRKSDDQDDEAPRKPRYNKEEAA